jgi:hypothetical protein
MSGDLNLRDFRGLMVRFPPAGTIDLNRLLSSFSGPGIYATMRSSTP